MNTPLTVSCPICHTPVVWNTQNIYRPFCSDRCRLIDLGEWAEGSRVIAVSDDSVYQDD